MIQPYYENAAIDMAPLSTAELPEPQDTDESYLNGTSEFARIFAEMLRNSGAKDAQIPEDTVADNALPSADKDILIDSETDMERLQGQVQKKGLFSGKFYQKTQTGEKDILAGELCPADFPELNQNILISADGFLNDTDECISSDNVQNQVSLMERSGEGSEVSADSLAALEQPELSGMAASLVNAGSAAEGEGQVNQKAALDKIAAKGKNRLSDDEAQPAPRGQTGDAAAVLAKDSEGKKGRLEEVRSKERRERPVIEVRDFRTGQSGGELRTGSELRVNAGLEKSPASGSAPAEMTLELRLPDQGQKAPAADSNWAAKSAHAFEDLLARELHQNFNNDIVRHASMVLRDEGKGMIRLALKPDSLGNVKIRLEMAENKITGQIVVESEEALRAFQKEIDSLEQAFKESGFQDANLEMSLAGDNNGAEQFQQDAQTRTLLSLFATAPSYNDWEQAETPITGAFARELTAINMLA